MYKYPLTIHRPDGVMLPVEHGLYQHIIQTLEPIQPRDLYVTTPPTIAPVNTCIVRVGQVCPHGYRLDPAGVQMQGWGCRVVALDHSLDLPGLDTDRLPPGLVRELIALPVGSPVEVLLDDGRVVATTVRRTASDLHGTWVAWLQDFTGCYLLARCRPAGWAYWSKRLDRTEASTSLRVDIVAGEVTGRER